MSIVHRQFPKVHRWSGTLSNHLHRLSYCRFGTYTKDFIGTYAFVSGSKPLHGWQWNCGNGVYHDQRCLYRLTSLLSSSRSTLGTRSLCLGMKRNYYSIVAVCQGEKMSCIGFSSGWQAQRSPVPSTARGFFNGARSLLPRYRIPSTRCIQDYSIMRSFGVRLLSQMCRSTEGKSDAETCDVMGQGFGKQTNVWLKLGSIILSALVVSSNFLGGPAFADARPSAFPFGNSGTEPASFFSTPPSMAKDSSILRESKSPLPSVSDLSAEELAVVKLFQQNTPAVVNVSNIAAARTPYSMDLMKIPLGQGSGFIWDNKGHIVTNAHVVRGAYEVRVSLIDQSVYKAKLVGKDDTKDIAVLQLIAPEDVVKQLRPIDLGSSSSLFVGQKVFAIGNPFGLDHTLTSGIISGLNRELADPSGVGLRNVIQTDAAINPGNSGGPLLNSKGKLIGINTAIASPSGAFNGVGFAIPVDSVKGLVEQILTYGRVVRPVLGITIAPPQALRQLKLEGVLVLDVPDGSPAFKAGMTGIRRDGFGRIVIGDVIVGLNGQKIRSEGELFDALDRCKVGQKVTVDILRRGTERMTLTVTLGDKPIEMIR